MTAVEVRVPSWSPPADAAGQWVGLQEQLVALLAVGGVPSCARDPEAWFPGRGVDVAVAVEACGWCPLVGPCGAYAVAAGEPEGVWGGLTPEDRRAVGVAL